MDVGLITKKALEEWKYKHKKKLIEDKGVYFPNSSKLTHQNWNRDSEKTNNYIQNLLEILNEFHQFAEQHDIIYSLIAGSLIGYYWNGNIIPWDDDIDICVCEKDYFKIRDILWSNGVHFKKNRDKYSSKKPWFKRDSRITLLNNKQYEIIPSELSTNPKLRNLIKIVPLQITEDRRNIGGLDITMCRTCKDGSLKEGWMRNLPCFITENSSEKDFPIVDFAGIKTRAVIKEIGVPFLDKVYGKKWIIPCHPSIKKDFNIDKYI